MSAHGPQAPHRRPEGVPVPGHTAFEKVASMKQAQMRITPKTGADIRAAPGSGGAAHCLPPDHQGICVSLCGFALLVSAGLVNAPDIDANSFRFITKMTPLRPFYLGNLQHNLHATLAPANPTTSPEDAELLKQLEQLLKPPR